jgi:peptidoglycan/xylan/chitin deacetylase (PgdA/CDA1 family)
MRRLFALALIMAACGTAPIISQPIGHTCQPLSSNQLNGMSLQHKQLSLTFDDGPGSRTLELSSYLKSQNIAAAFFVNGHCFEHGNPCGNHLQAQEVLSQLVADGHIIANHSHNHIDLTDAALSEQAIINELADTDAIIKPYVEFNRFLFRPPFGSWDERTYNILNSCEMSKYVGPIRWDVGGTMGGDFAADWNCWQGQGEGIKTTSECGIRYMNEIHAVDHGIVLMHDSDNGGPLGNTIDMVKFMIPVLKAEGYFFVRLDEVPSIAALLSNPPQRKKDAGVEDASLPIDASSVPLSDAGKLSPPMNGGIYMPETDPCK